MSDYNNAPHTPGNNEKREKITFETEILVCDKDKNGRHVIFPNDYIRQTMAEAQKATRNIKGVRLATIKVTFEIVPYSETLRK